MGRIAALLALVALCAGPAPSARAETAAADAGAEVPAGGAADAPAESGSTSGAAPAESAGAEAPAEGASAARVAVDAPIPPDAKIDAYPGVIHKVMAEGMLVRRVGRGSDPRAPAYMAFWGKLGVPVEGQGKNNWMALRRGDVVMVSYVKGPPHRITKVNVLPKSAQPNAADAPPIPSGRRQRSFVGYIKKKEGDALVVMSPRGVPPSRRQAEVKAFVRTEKTQVEVLRDSWDALRKGDRVLIGHQKGNPRPIDVVQVIRKAGEEPMPPGLPTRLFHPDYDQSVRDVDGIGETQPVPPPRPVQLRNPIRIKPATEP